MFPGAFQTLRKKLTVMAARGPQREKTLTKREGERKCCMGQCKSRMGQCKSRRDSTKMWAAQPGGEDCAAARMEENVKRIDPDAVWRPTRGPAQRDANQARKRHGEADPFNRYKNILTYAVHLIKRFVFRCRRLAAHVIILKKVQRILETSTGHP
jgi:hypothetical protein